MVCSPADNNLNPPILPPPTTPFGVPFAGPQIPFPDVQLPDGIPEDILALIDRFLSQWPGGPLVPNLDKFAKEVIDAIASLFNQMAPYLALYRFLQPLLNLLLCIIDILCALLNPFKLRRAMKKLFKRCLPDFLNLFPWLALIAMIIALLLLLLAIIEYLINKILSIIRDIIENIITLGAAVGFGDEDRQLAGIRKIAQLLCMIEELFAILVAIQAILAIIQALASIRGRTVCGKKGSTDGDDAECCTDEVCPPFIANNPDGLTGNQGTLIYHNRVDQDTSGFGFPIILPAQRNERWQFVDREERDFNFKDIITEIDGNIFWPEGLEFNRSSNIKKVPYTLDMRLNIDPALFGHADPIGGSRDFIIKDVIVTEKPTIGTLTYNDSLDTSSDFDDGTLKLEGGKVFESDEETPFNLFGQQADLNNFIHFDAETGLPGSEDGYFVNNISYTLNYNFDVLLEHALITLGCAPDVETETTIANIAVPSLQTVTSRIGNLPNVGTIDPPTGALGCLTTSIADFRQDVNPETAAIFQQNVTACLTDLQEETIQAYTNAVTAGTSTFETSATLDPEVQFVSLPIKLTVELRDFNGTPISFRVPEVAQSDLAEKIGANITFGEITDFTFDGYQAFEALITSDKAGEGEVTVSFDGNILSNIIGQDDDNVTTVIEEQVLTYEFVGTGQYGFGPDAGEPQPVPRRDETDVSGND